MAAQENSSCEVLDNWEDIDENQILERLPMPERTKHPQPIGPIIVQGEDAYRSQYVPPEPSVKILKRPSKAERLSGVNGVKQSLPVKTLQQREAEYAEARLRILGQAKSPEDDLDDRLTASSSGVSTPESITILASQKPVKILQAVVREPKNPPDDQQSGFTLKR